MPVTDEQRERKREADRIYGAMRRAADPTWRARVGQGYREPHPDADRIAGAKYRAKMTDEQKAKRNARARELNVIDPEKRRASARKYYRLNRDKVAAYMKTRRQENNAISRQYRTGWTVEQYDAAVIAQSNRCSICGANGEKRTLHADHCHETGAPRKLLCHKCNVGLGSFLDDPALLLSAYVYMLTAGT